MAKLQMLFLGLILYFDNLQQTHVSTSNDISLCEAKIIFSNYLVFALTDVFTLEFSVFINDVVEGVYVHVGTEP
jgi:hypothetical protein